MRAKWVLLAALAILLATLGYFYLSGRLEFLILDTRASFEKNDKPVRGEILRGHATAVVTIRNDGTAHSFLLFFAGDTDQMGDVGVALDCRRWVAPHLPLLFETRNYPPCGDPLEHMSQGQRIRLINKGESIFFVLPDQSTIRISR